MRYTRLATISLMLVGLTGCSQKFNHETTVTLDLGTPIRAVAIDPPRGEQNVTVDIESNNDPVSGYLVLEGDENKAMLAIGDAAKVVSKKENEKKFTLEGKIPSKQGYAVVVKIHLGEDKSKKSDVKIAIKGR